MKKFSNTRCILIALTLAGLFAIPVALHRTAPATQAQGGFISTLERIRLEQSQRLEGSWLVNVTIARPNAPPPFRVYFSFARGGSFVSTDTRRPYNQGHGAWTHLGGDEFAFTGAEDLFDAMGNFAGTFKGRARITLTSANLDAFTGVSNAEQRNAAGQIILNGCSTMRAERITVEPLAPQCQSIAPPQ